MAFQIKDIDWSLYAIIDRESLEDRSVHEVAEAMIRGGAGVVQYRDKISDTETFYQTSLSLFEITRKYHIPFIVNDRLDMALAIQADGVHLGQEDLQFIDARKITGEHMLIGGSVSSVSEFNKIKNLDYFGVGSVYPTKTKKDAEMGGIELIRKIRLLTDKPLIGIGGITLENVTPVIQEGCHGVAVISAIMHQIDIEKAARELFNKVKAAQSVACSSD
jgi:thiamine-phosphate pyrophosphorylase